jgi:hypothetical protein
MLRVFVLGLGLVLMGGGVVGITFGAGGFMLAPLILGVLVLIGTVFEPHYKRNQSASPTDGFIRTGERFHDPAQGGIVEVWYNKTSGERRYISPPK